MSEFWVIERKDQAQKLCDFVMSNAEERKVRTYHVKAGKPRTTKQQSALEVWCRATAKFFNDSGFTREIRCSIFKDGSFECDWTRSSVKDEVWRPVQVALTKKESTTEADTVDYALVYETLVRAFGGKGITLPPWPTRHG